MSELALESAGKLLSRKVGLRIEASMRGRVERCLLEEAQTRNESVGDFVTRLESDPTALQALLNRVTVQESWFFRDEGQFEVLARRIVPHLEPPVTIWSAGCSNGQEAYSLAMALDESEIGDWTIVASDVSTRALDRARAGRYRERELRGISPERRARYLIDAGDEWEIDARLRARVSVVQHNLVTDAPPFPPRRCPVVFCRNVLIYFRREDSLAFLQRLHGWLPPGGYLFLGYSESLWQVTNLFELVELDENFVYRRPKVILPPRGEARPARSARDSVKAREPQARPPYRQSRRSIAADVSQLMATGEEALAHSDYGAAIAAFRRAVYMDPGHPVAHLCLGLSLEAVEDLGPARRSYSAARSALERSDTSTVETLLEGYRVDQLVALLDAKLRQGGSA